MGVNDKLKWDSVQNAQRYRVVYGNGEGTLVYEGSNTEIKISDYLTNPGTYSLKVKAKADGYIDSDWSNSVNYTIQNTEIPKPTNLRYNYYKDTLIFDVNKPDGMSSFTALLMANGILVSSKTFESHYTLFSFALESIFPEPTNVNLTIVLTATGFTDSIPSDQIAFNNTQLITPVLTYDTDNYKIISSPVPWANRISVYNKNNQYLFHLSAFNFYEMWGGVDAINFLGGGFGDTIYLVAANDNYPEDFISSRSNNLYIETP